MNKVIILGRITKEIVPTFTPSTGLAVSRFTVAVDRGKDKGADFISCVSFGKTAETIAQYFEKGDRILIEGRIQTGSYEKDGTKVFTTDIVIDKFYFIEKKGKQEKQEVDLFTKATTDYKVDDIEPVDCSDIPF